MTRNYTTFTSEMGEKAAAGTQIVAETSVISGKKTLKTNLELSGVGITFTGKNTSGKNTYLVTRKAFDKLCNQYKVAYHGLL